MKKDSKRYLGLELAGAKNQKTAVAALDYYPKGKKVFLLDIYDRLPSGDQPLLELFDEMNEGIARMGVNVPLELPPCLSCTKKSCAAERKCQSSAVAWLREVAQKALASGARGKRLYSVHPASSGALDPV